MPKPRIKKAEKDLNEPKKPPTPFILFFKDKKSIYQEKHKDLGLNQITSLISKEWRELPEDKQQVDIPVHLYSPMQVNRTNYSSNTKTL